MFFTRQFSVSFSFPRIYANTQKQKIWYEETGGVTEKGKKQLLFHLLLDICSSSLEYNRKALKSQMDKVKLTNPKGWDVLYNYEELRNDVRQDKVVEEKTHENLMRYPIRLDYGLKELNNVQMEGFYDTTCYLGKLKITAHQLNETFHKDMREIFQIDPKTGWSKDKKMVYRSGPIKDIVRCKAKAENDYAEESYPTSAKIADFIRCSFVFKRCEECVRALDTLKKVAESKKTCIKGIGRIKNM